MGCPIVLAGIALQSEVWRSQRHSPLASRACFSGWPTVCRARSRRHAPIAVRLDPASYLLCFIFGIHLPALDNTITINRIILADASAAPGLVSGNNGRPAASKQIEDDGTAGRDVLYRVNYHRHRFDRRMQCQFVKPSGFDRVDTAVLPDIGAVASVLTELKMIVVRGCAALEGKYQFVSRSVECTHPAIVLCPHDQILEFGVDAASS